MRTITLTNITKRYHGELILDKINLTIPGGTFFALLGPSGSGKTTLLRLLAGFEEPDTGTIMLGDDDITHKPIHQRRINTVFQQYALFPHMNVFENIAFGLRIKGMQEQLIKEKVGEMVKTVDLEKQMYKAIHHLSGGQQQRVALARAIVNEPDVLLLDEPLAALDLKMREKMLLELIELQATLKTTFVYVTHDQFEALTVADHMAIMNHDGEIEQVGTPKNIYEFPVSSFVAQFVGTTNLFKGNLLKQNGLDFLAVQGIGSLAIQMPKTVKITNTTEQFFLSIRPEKIDVSKEKQSGFSNQLTGTVVAIVYHGRSTQYNVMVGSGQIIQVFEQNDEHFPKEVIDYDDKVYLYWQKENGVVLTQ